jgi:hypothetical protein
VSALTWADSARKGQIVRSRRTANVKAYLTVGAVGFLLFALLYLNKLRLNQVRDDDAVRIGSVDIHTDMTLGQLRGQLGLPVRTENGAYGECIVHFGNGVGWMSHVPLLSVSAIVRDNCGSLTDDCQLFKWTISKSFQGSVNGIRLAEIQALPGYRVIHDQDSVTVWSEAIGYRSIN